MKQRLSKSLFALFLLTVSFVAGAQSTQGVSAEKWYLDLPSLNTDNYVTLHETLKSHARFEIQEACVPAHVVVIRLRSGVTPSSDDSSKLQQILTAKGFANVAPMATQTPESFMERCRSARFGQ